jgi:predicted porin
MKKQLLATTALVAVGVLAAASGADAQTVKLGVGGYMSQEFGFVFDKQDGNTNGRPDVSGTGADTGVQFDQQSDVEVYFLGSGKLDNGIEVGARVELEVAGSPGNMIDEHYAFVRGSFGQIEIGATDSAAIKTTLGYMGSWATQVGENSAFGPGDWINGAFTGAGGTFGGQDGTMRNMQLRVFDDDGNKISYYSPRFEGFQAGVSYTPNTAQNTQTGAGATELVTNVQSTYHDYWSFGANYDRKFGDFGIGVAAGYVTAKSPGTTPGTTATTWKNTDDLEAWGIGTSFEFGPFKISGAYRETQNVRDTAGASTLTSLDGALYDIGARYTFGPNAVSVSYRDGYIDGIKADAFEPEESAFMASYRRTLGPGVNWALNLFYLHSESEQVQINGQPAGQANPKEVNGWALTTGLLLVF